MFDDVRYYLGLVDDPERSVDALGDPTTAANVRTGIRTAWSIAVVYAAAAALGVHSDLGKLGIAAALGVVLGLIGRFTSRRRRRLQQETWAVTPDPFPEEEGPAEGRLEGVAWILASAAVAVGAAGHWSVLTLAGVVAMAPLLLRWAIKADREEIEANTSSRRKNVQ